MRCAYPLMLDLTDRAVVIIGGGAVAARKAAGVIAAGAKHVTVIAPKLTAQIPPGVQHLPELYKSEHLTAAELVFAATDQPDINAKIVRDAKAAGILANRADTDDVDPGDFTVPAVLRRGSLVISVSATEAPALAARVRDEIATHLEDRWTKLADATKTLRPRIIESISDPTRRRAALHDLATPEAADLAASGEASIADWLANKYPELKPGKSQPPMGHR